MRHQRECSAVEVAKFIHLLDGQNLRLVKLLETVDGGEVHLLLLLQLLALSKLSGAMEGRARPKEYRWVQRAENGGRRGEWQDTVLKCPARRTTLVQSVEPPQHALGLCSCPQRSCDLVKVRLSFDKFPARTTRPKTTLD